MSSPSPSRPKPPARQPTTSRLPAPSLFVGPPSRNASNLDLTNPSNKSSPTTTALATKASASTTPSSAHQQPSPHTPAPARPSPITTASTTTFSPAAAARPPFRPTDTAPLPPRASLAQTDAQWADLQSTLSDVELSAAAVGGTGSRGNAFFGAAHASALADLRKAQVELARAWARGEDEARDADRRDGGSVDGGLGRPLLRERSGGQGRRASSVVQQEEERARARHKAAAAAAAGGADSRRASAAGRGSGEDGGGQDGDVSAAAARRAANERYFARVKTGVQDVVARLEAVSTAMRGVEMQSRELWGDGESLASVETSEAR